MSLDLEKIRSMADRVAGSLGLEIVDLEFRGGAGKQGRLLRVFIDKAPAKVMPGANESGTDGTAAGSVAETSSPTPNPAVLGEEADLAPVEAAGSGVTLNDCERVSRELSTLLDVEDVVPGGEYTLEVSSPGLDRRLSTAADFRRFVGSVVKVMTHEPVGVTESSKGNRHFQGRLKRFEDGRLILDVMDTGGRKQKPKPGRHAAESHRVEIELSNVERANLVPEI